MNRLLSIVLTILLSATSLNVSARSDNRTGVSAGTMIMGGKMLFAAIELQMYNDCKAPGADMWEMEPVDRDNLYMCAKVFKDYKDSKGLSLYRKAEVLAKSSYSKLKRALISESVAAGGPSEPPEGCDAHHIVPRQDKRAFSNPYASDAREILKECKIDIDSAENGIFLPNRQDGTSKCTGPYHRNMHNESYYKYVFETLHNGKDNNGCDGVIEELKAIKNKLLNGNY